MPALLQNVPTFVTREEHQTLVSRTPESFSDIPTVIRHKQENVKVSLDPPMEGFSDEDCAQGTLYVLESILVFMSVTGRGFGVEYPHITLHAVSGTSSGSPSIYCQLEEPTSEMDVDFIHKSGANGVEPSHAEQDSDEEEEEEETDRSGDDDDDDDDDFPSMQELKIVPQDGAAVEVIFEALSHCASLHPDEPSPSDSGSEDSAFIDAPETEFDTFDGTEEQELSEVGRAALAHLESIIYNPFDQTKSQGEDGEANGQKSE